MTILLTVSSASSAEAAASEATAVTSTTPEPGTSNGLLSPKKQEELEREAAGDHASVIERRIHRDLTTPPPLHFVWRWTRPSLYLAFLLFCNVLIPCLLYYLLLIYTSVDDKEVIGISSAALGLSSCFDAPFRLYKLIKYHKHYGPLDDGKWWHLDATMHMYNVALWVFAVPLAIAPAIPLYDFFLMSTAMLTAPVGIMFLISLHPFRLPFYFSSDKPGTPTKPCIFYIMEDVPAVDFGRGKVWRQEIHDRYAASKPFRDLMWWLTLYWAFMCAVHFGVCAAITWASPIGVAFGLILGMFFIWAIIAALGNWAISHWWRKRELEWWQTQEPGTVLCCEGKVWN